jgi:hypothetical protein
MNSLGKMAHVGSMHGVEDIVFRKMWKRITDPMMAAAVDAIHGAAFRDMGTNDMAGVKQIMVTLRLDNLQVPPALMSLLGKLPEPCPDMEWEDDEDDDG